MTTKAALRALALARRDAEPDRDRKSRRILDRVMALPDFGRAGTVATYVGVKSEVTTANLLRAAMSVGTRTAVPCREGDELALYAIEMLGELEEASFGLREPAARVRADPDRRVAPETVDLLVVPGVAFDRRGGRIGYGRGYYDRLLARCRPDAPRVGLAFECQLVEAIPMGPADQPMDLVVPEADVYRVSERGAPTDR